MSKGHSDGGRLDNAARAAWLYYIAGNTQDEIARKLDVSRQSAQRLVSLAVSEKLIKFRLDHPIARCMDLAERLTDRFGLQSCDVAPTDPDAPDLITGVAIAGANALQAQLSAKEPKIIALGTGRSLRACVEQLPPMECPQHRLVSLVGNTHTDGSATPYNVVVQLAGLVGTIHNPMPLAVLVRNPAELPLLHHQEPVAKTLELCRNADVTFVGIGHIGLSGPMTVDGFITKEECRALLDAGAVGEIVGWVYDSGGRLVRGLTNDRVSSAPLIADNPRPVIAVAAGEQKHAAIRSALVGRLINGLVTDEATAQAVLKLG